MSEDIKETSNFKGVLIFISHLPLDSTYPLKLTIKGEIEGLHIQQAGFKLDQYIQGFYIRNATGLTNGRPSWTDESGLPYSIWFDDKSKYWRVGLSSAIGTNGTIRTNILQSSTSPDSTFPHEAQNWEYHHLTNGKWIMSSDISITAGMYTNSAIEGNFHLNLYENLISSISVYRRNHPWYAIATLMPVVVCLVFTMNQWWINEKPSDRLAYLPIVIALLYPPFVAYRLIYLLIKKDRRWLEAKRNYDTNISSIGK